jgi:hypothetical protein
MISERDLGRRVRGFPWPPEEREPVRPEPFRRCRHAPGTISGSSRYRSLGLDQRDLVAARQVADPGEVAG